MIYLLFADVEHIALQSGHLLPMTLPSPNRRNATVYQLMFQNAHTFKSCSRNNAPNNNIRKPHMVLHLSQPIIEITSAMLWGKW